MDQLVFYGLGLISVVASLAVISRKQPVTAVMWLLVLVLSLAGMFFSLHAQFLGVLQIFLYGDAVTVIFIFIIMSMNIPEEQLPEEGLSFTGFVAVAISGFVALLLSIAGGTAAQTDAPVHAEGFGSIAQFADLMFGKHFLAFEAISVLLLVAIIGAVVLSRKEVIE
jgi:NADH-quinone oxidoreductase subunit J